MKFLLTIVMAGLVGYGIAVGNAPASGTVTNCNLVSIDGQLTSGNNAVLHLRQLDIRNNAGSAIVAWSTGGNGSGIDALGHHGIKGRSNVAGGSGMHLEGNNMGDGPITNGGDGLSAQGFGWGGGIVAHGGRGTPEGQNGGPGLFTAADGGFAAGWQSLGRNFPGVLIDGATQGVLIRGGNGPSGGTGVLIQAQGPAGYRAVSGNNSDGTSGVAEGMHANRSSVGFAFLRSGASKPSVNQP